MTLKLQNNVTKRVYTFENLEDLLKTRLFYTFDITFPEGMDDGEYAYTLYDEQNIVKATGLLQVGDYVPNNNTYTAQTQNGYIQYNGTI